MFNEQIEESSSELLGGDDTDAVQMDILLSSQHQ